LAENELHLQRQLAPKARENWGFCITILPWITKKANLNCTPVAAADRFEGLGFLCGNFFFLPWSSTGRLLEIDGREICEMSVLFFVFFFVPENRFSIGENNRNVEQVWSQGHKKEGLVRV
jgi:hypothetical protein